MDLSVLKPSRLPISRTASPVSHRDDLNGGFGDPVNYPVRKTSEKKFPRIMQMHRPTLRTGLDLTDGVIEFNDESICGQRDCVRHTTHRQPLPQRSPQDGA